MTLDELNDRVRAIRQRMFGAHQHYHWTMMKIGEDIAALDREWKRTAPDAADIGMALAQALWDGFMAKRKEGHKA
jgi:hypothetical protein